MARRKKTHARGARSGVAPVASKRDEKQAAALPREDAIDASAEPAMGEPPAPSLPCEAEDNREAEAPAGPQAPDPSDPESLGQFEARFFSQQPDYGPEAESIPPTAEDLDASAPVSPPPPHVLARRSVFRKAVGGVFAAAVLLLVIGAGRQVAARLPTNPAATAERAIPAAVIPPSAPPRATPGRAASPAPSAEAAPSASTPPAVKNPRREAERLLQAGKLKQAVAMASLAVDRDPTDAHSYLLWASALQELGQHPKAREVLNACAKSGKGPSVWECRALAGR